MASGTPKAPHAFLLGFNMIFKLLLPFWTAQACPDALAAILDCAGVARMHFRQISCYFGLRRRDPDALSASLDCTGVAQAYFRRIIAFPFSAILDCAGAAQTHFRQMIAFLDRVSMGARAPISPFSICLCFW